MITRGWTVYTTVEELEEPSTPAPFDAEVVAVGRAEWMRQVGLEPGTMYLISPICTYDTVLNSFFGSPGMRTKAVTTQGGYARDVAAYLTFLDQSRKSRGGAMPLRPITWLIMRGDGGIPTARGSRVPPGTAKSRRSMRSPGGRSKPGTSWPARSRRPPGGRA